MTEYEAKQKWCPMVRFTADSGSYDSNRINFQDENPEACIGSKCMAWIWDNNTMSDADYRAQRMTPEKNVKGYCGLAGKP